MVLRSSASCALQVLHNGKHGVDWELKPYMLTDWWKCHGHHIRSHWSVRCLTQVKLGRALGKGTFGTTFMGRWRGGEVAVKSVHIEQRDEAESFLREVHVLACIRHPNVMPFYGEHGCTARPLPAHVCFACGSECHCQSFHQLSIVMPLYSEEVRRHGCCLLMFALLVLMIVMTSVASMSWLSISSKPE